VFGFCVLGVGFFGELFGFGLGVGE